METKPTQRFYQFRGDKMMDTFGIRPVKQCSFLEEWLNAYTNLTDFEDQTLEAALIRYEKMGRGWNEEELKMHFISAVLNVADPNIEGVCKTFFERPLDGIIGQYELHVITDCMVATPKLGGSPVKPFFFLQEFKQAQLWGKTDPQGQMLAAMLLAQQQNADGKCIYGCFVKENNWRFATLTGSDYCVSPQFDSTKKPELLQIVYILRKLKELILARVTP
jgi:hypothetical protein